MARFKIKAGFRSQFSEKIMDLGNLVAVALVFGQFISDKEFSWLIFIAGMSLAIFCYTISYLVND